MKVFINNREIVLFRGATLKEAVLSYSVISYKKIMSGYLGIYDRFGFLTESDGPVAEGQHFYLKVKNKQN